MAPAHDTSLTWFVAVALMIVTAATLAAFWPLLMKAVA